MKKKMFLFNGLEQKIMCIDSKSVHRIEWQREEREHSFFIEARKRELLIQASLLHHNVKSLFRKHHYCVLAWSPLEIIFFVLLHKLTCSVFSLILYETHVSCLMSHASIKNAPYWSDVWSLYLFIRRFARYLVGIYRRAKRKYLSENELC